ncbi:MAG: transposase [Propionivibrio sp.]|nr:transposase [Propionivibrio sp.]
MTGFGPIISAALVSEMGDGSQFVNGREFAAWCGPC